MLFVTLNSVWPNRQRQAALVAFLFMIYPVFNQQPISMTYHQIWLHYIFYFLSLWLMVIATRVNGLSRGKTILISFLALIFLTLNLSISEYFIGMELVRPLFLFFIVPFDQPFIKRIKDVLLRWLPYLSILCSFVVWRIMAFQQVGESPNRPVLLLQFLSDPLQAVQRFVQFVLQDLILIIGASWYKTLDPTLINLSSPFLIFSWGLVIAVTLGCLIFLIRFNEIKLPTPAEPQQIISSSKGSSSSWLGQAIMVALVSLLAGPLPVWVTDKQAAIGFYSNRFALTAMFGASLLFVVVLEWLVKNWRQKVIIVSLLCGLAAGFHLRTANDYRWSWTKQTRFYWQLFWRAPDIQPHTAFISDGTVLPFVNPTLSLNVLYLQPRASRELAFYYFSLGKNVKPWLKPHLLEGYSREFPFSGNSQDSLVFFYNPPNCLWILGPDDSSNPELPDSIRDVLINSNLNRIRELPASDAYPPVDVFGAELEHGWCYSYQKADLARQYSRWDQVISISEQAIQEGYLAGTSPSEWIPLIEAYAAVGRLDDAFEITQKNLNKDPLYLERYCDLWEKIAALQGDSLEVRNKIDQLICP
jgi:hypothetical protein